MVSKPVTRSFVTVDRWQVMLEKEIHLHTESPYCMEMLISFFQQV